MRASRVVHGITSHTRSQLGRHDIAWRKTTTTVKATNATDVTNSTMDVSTFFRHGQDASDVRHGKRENDDDDDNVYKRVKSKLVVKSPSGRWISFLKNDGGEETERRHDG